MMLKKISSIICMIASIILMATPYGVAMTFLVEVDPDVYQTNYFSYFSDIPWGGGADLCPIATALMSIVVLTLLFTGFKTDISPAVKVLLLCCIGASIISWLVFKSFTFVALAVTVLHAITFILQICPKKDASAKMQR